MIDPLGNYVIVGTLGLVAAAKQFIQRGRNLGLWGA